MHSAGHSLGMDYTMDTKNKKLKGSINISPLATSYRYVQFHSLTQKYGIEGDDMHKLDFGSQFTLDMEWQLMTNCCSLQMFPLRWP